MKLIRRHFQWCAFLFICSLCVCSKFMPIFSLVARFISLSFADWSIWVTRRVLINKKYRDCLPSASTWIHTQIFGRVRVDNLFSVLCFFVLLVLVLCLTSIVACVCRLAIRDYSLRCSLQFIYSNSAYMRGKPWQIFYFTIIADS